MVKSYGQHCSLARALDKVGERWTLLIVRELLLGPARYTDLREALPGLATNLLADRLRGMEGEGLVQRRRLPPPAATTVYELTEVGRGLREAVDALVRWGGRWMGEPGEQDVFRPQWLAIALQAMTQPPADADSLTCRVEVEGHTFTLALSGGRADVAADGEAQADIVVQSDPRTLFAVASGAFPLSAAIASGALRADGDEEAIVALGRIWGTTAATSSR